MRTDARRRRGADAVWEYFRQMDGQKGQNQNQSRRAKGVQANLIQMYKKEKALFLQGFFFVLFFFGGFDEALCLTAHANLFLDFLYPSEDDKHRANSRDDH